MSFPKIPETVVWRLGLDYPPSLSGTGLERASGRTGIPTLLSHERGRRSCSPLKYSPPRNHAAAETAGRCERDHRPHNKRQLVCHAEARRLNREAS